MPHGHRGVRGRSRLALASSGQDQACLPGYRPRASPFCEGCDGPNYSLVATALAPCMPPARRTSAARAAQRRRGQLGLRAGQPADIVPSAEARPPGPAAGTGSGARSVRGSWRPPRPSPVRLHPNLAQVYRRKVERLHEALADPALRDEALGLLRGLIERVVLHPAADGQEIEIVGEIVRMVELGRDAKQAALDAEAACSVKVVAGAVTDHSSHEQGPTAAVHRHCARAGLGRTRARRKGGGPAPLRDRCGPAEGEPSPDCVPNIGRWPAGSVKY